MNVHDYITRDDACSLTSEEYYAFRMYLRFLGHKVSDEYGDLSLSASSAIFALVLWDDGDLVWADTVTLEDMGGTKISLEEVKRMAKLGMFYEHG